MVTVSVSISSGTVVVTIAGDEKVSAVDVEESVDRDVGFIVDMRRLDPS